jgi:hypothetical protein
MAALRKRPLLMTLGMIFAGGNAFVALVVTPVILISQDDIISNGKRMTTGYFAIHELPLLLIYGIVTGAIFWTFLKGKKWSRHIVMVFWIWMLVIAFIDVTPEEGRAGVMIMLGVLLALSGFYFYLKRNIVAYYKEIGKISAK